MALMKISLLALTFLCLVTYSYTICRDNVRFCSYWAGRGECSRNPRYMKVNCQKSCNSCPKSQAQGRGCTDHNNHCSYWASTGECRRNQGYMHVYCRKSCKLCGQCKYVACIAKEWSSWSSTCGMGRRTRTIKTIAKTIQRANCNGLKRSCSDVNRMQTRNVKCPKKERCYVRGKEFKIGETYVSDDCSQICICKGNFPPLCSSLCPKRSIVCPPGELKVEKIKRIKKSNCSCVISNCVKKDATINSPGCGLSNTTGPSIRRFIIGGQDAKPGDWPWMIAVVKVKSPGKIYCGATLLNSNWAISAAHCFRKPFRDDPSQYMLRVGEYSLKTKGNEISRQVKKIILHEDYDRKSFDNDIALLLLDEPIKYSESAKPICIQEDTWTDMSIDQCVVTGWGRTKNELGPRSDVLQELQVPIISRDVCQRGFKFFKKSITSNMICAGYITGGRDSCKGDSGGPLMCRSTPLSSWKQVGIVSFGRGCARNGLAGVYTKVSNYVPWIKRHLTEFKMK